jgi:hypothetical protein
MQAASPSPLLVHRLLTSGHVASAAVTTDPRELTRAGRQTLRIGGLTLAVEPTSPGLKLDVRGPARAFLDPSGEADLLLRAERRHLGSEAPGPVAFDSGGAWRLYDADGAHVYRLFAASHGDTPYQEAWIQPGAATGALYLNAAFYAPNEPVDALQFPLDELLFLRLLSVHGGVELHACGVVGPDGRGYLFAGQSGDGKTTTARLWQGRSGCTVLSDDRIVLRRGDDGRWWMHGTPWHGEAELAANARAPLAGLYLLGRGERNELERLTPAQSVAGLFARSFLAFHDASVVARALGEIESLVERHPCSRFRFVPAEEAVRFLLEQAGR